MPRMCSLSSIDRPDPNLLTRRSALPVPPEVEASYTVIIDDILAHSDLNTVSAKRIRKGLQARVAHDITPEKVSAPDALRFYRAADPHVCPRMPSPTSSWRASTR